jgi:uncharacterized protein (DUF433 family)
LLLNFLRAIVPGHAVFMADLKTKPSIDADPRKLPAYPISEVAHYLHIPLATLRSWVHGRPYPTTAGKRYFKRLIDLPDPKFGALSFMNLVEAHVLNAIRRDDRIALPKVRGALDYVRKRFGWTHPLAEQKFQTDGMNLFVSRFEKSISVSESGQLAIRELIKAHLHRIEHDASGLAARLYLFTRQNGLDQPRFIVIDPLVSFGRPTITGTGVTTSILAERYKAGDSMDALAEDYGCKRAQIEEAVRCELALAA